MRMILYTLLGLEAISTILIVELTSHSKVLINLSQFKHILKMAHEVCVGLKRYNTPFHCVMSHIHTIYARIHYVNLCLNY
jgi:hypothetical protein